MNVPSMSPCTSCSYGVCMIHHILHTDLAFSAQVVCWQMSAATPVPMRGSVAQTPMAAPKPVAKKIPVQPEAPPSEHITTKVEVRHKAPPPEHIPKKIELKPKAPPPSDGADHDECLHHGVAEVQTDGVGENADGQVRDLCGVGFKNLTLWLDKSVFKLFLHNVLNISDGGI